MLRLKRWKRGVWFSLLNEFNDLAITECAFSTSFFRKKSYEINFYLFLPDVHVSVMSGAMLISLEYLIILMIIIFLHFEIENKHFLFSVTSI